MSSKIVFRTSTARPGDIADHLKTCDRDFDPPLSSRVQIEDYAVKIAGKAVTFEAWSGDKLIGLVASYLNDQQDRVAFITNVSSDREWTSKGVATELLRRCIAHARKHGIRLVTLKVAKNSHLAIKLYQRCGFVVERMDKCEWTMHLQL